MVLPHQGRKIAPSVGHASFLDGPTGAVREEGSMDFVLEAKKFVQRANDANHPEVIKEHLKMADWCLKQAIDERSGSNGEASRKAS
jgi:hypothetical protein